MNISKADLVNMLTQEDKVYKRYMTKDIVDDIFDEVANTPRNGDRVSICGLGTFDVKKYKSHPALHPVIKESIVVLELQNVMFKFGVGLLRSIRERL